MPFFIARTSQTEHPVDTCLTIVDGTPFTTREEAERAAGGRSADSTRAVVEAVDGQIAALRACYAATGQPEPPGGWDRYKPFLDLCADLRGEQTWAQRVSNSIHSYRAGRDPVQALRSVLGELREDELSRRLRLELRIYALLEILDTW